MDILEGNKLLMDFMGVKPRLSAPDTYTWSAIKTKVTPGKWFLEKYVLDSEAHTTSQGTPSEHNIAAISDEHPDYAYNKSAIVAAVNFFKSVDWKLLNKQTEILANMIASWGEADDLTQKGDAKTAEGLHDMLFDMKTIMINAFGADKSLIFNSNEEE